MPGFQFAPAADSTSPKPGKFDGSDDEPDLEAGQSLSSPGGRGPSSGGFKEGHRALKSRIDLGAAGKGEDEKMVEYGLWSESNSLEFKSCLGTLLYLSASLRS